MTSELLPISLFETSVSRDVWFPQITPGSNFRKKYDEKMVTVNRASAMESINKINLFLQRSLSHRKIVFYRRDTGKNDTRARAAVILPKKCCLQISFSSFFPCFFFPVLILFGTKMYGTIVVPYRPFFLWFRYIWRLHFGFCNFFTPSFCSRLCLFFFF